jgi:hypothetical protein
MSQTDDDLVEQFFKPTQKILSPRHYDQKWGLVIYSNKTTLRRNNRVLFYGVNPGYDPEVKQPIRWSINDSLTFFADGFRKVKDESDSDSNKLLPHERLHPDCNLIDDQSWPDRGNPARGRAKYQQATRCLLKGIGHPDALVTNWFFHQTKNVAELDSGLKDTGQKDFLDACWRVHQLIFEITKPRVIVTCSSVLERGLKKRLGLKRVPPDKDSGYGPNGRKWKCREWEGTWGDQRIVVCQVPHSTYYDFEAEYCKTNDVIGWAKQVVAKAVGR